MIRKIHLRVTLPAGRPRRILARVWWILACALLLLRPPITARAQDIHQTAKAVDEHYNRLRTLQTDFTEIYQGAGMERVEAGTLWLKKPRKMRWEYRSPKEKLFISDGKAVWFYLPAERQLRKTEFRKLDDLRSPLAFLLGKAKLENELQGLSKVVDQPSLEPGNTLLRGVPKAMADRVSDVLLEITPASQIARIVLTEVDGTTTEFRFSRPKENLDLSDGRFQFTPPPDVETVEGELGQ
ncbi:MAG: outer membrane lipoprotein carrier protein LolA [Acidobacteriales bacterium]|nr:outer membrane lipoprotein carrier protein LolA [Terriglobales bacterium]